MPGGRRPGTWKCPCGTWNVPPGAERCSRCHEPKPKKQEGGMRQQIERSVKRNTAREISRDPEKRKRQRPPSAKGNPQTRKRSGPSLANTPLALDIERSVRKRLEERQRKEARDGTS